jgi:hypothetical protein
MRLTVYLNEEDQPATHFAVLWLDLDDHIWSREGHRGIELPSWGTLRVSRNATSLCGETPADPLCELHELGAAVLDQPPASACGAATWIDHDDLTIVGRWHLQAVDREHEIAETSVFKTPEDLYRHRH